MISIHSFKKAAHAALILFVSGFSLSNAFADAVDDALKALEAAVQHEVAEAKAEPTQRNSYEGRGNMGAVVLAQLRSALSRNEPQQLNEVLNQLPAYFKSEAVLAASGKLREELRAQEQVAEQAFVTQIRGAIEQAGKAVKSATKASDLDETLRVLAGFREQNRASETSRAEAGKIQSARQFVIYWQDYLACLESLNIKEAIQKLQNVSGMNEPELLPRSQVLARLEELKQPGKGAPESTSVSDDRVREIMTRVKTLDDLPVATRALSDVLRLRNSGAQGMTNDDSRVQLGSLIGEMQAVWQTYNQYQAGLPAKIEWVAQNSRTNTDEYSEIVKLKTELVLKLFARQLGVEDKLKPLSSEPVTTYIARVLADARERGDARLMLRVRDLQAANNMRARGDDIWLKSLLAAQNQEEASQFIPAVISYQNALKSGGDLTPAKVIGQHLDAIKSEHPEEFEKGMQLFLNINNPTQQQ